MRIVERGPGPATSSWGEGHLSGAMQRLREQASSFTPGSHETPPEPQIIHSDNSTASLPQELSPQTLRQRFLRSKPFKKDCPQDLACTGPGPPPPASQGPASLRRDGHAALGGAGRSWESVTAKLLSSHSCLCLPCLTC